MHVALNPPRAFLLFREKYVPPQAEPAARGVGGRRGGPLPGAWFAPGRRSGHRGARRSHRCTFSTCGLAWAPPPSAPRRRLSGSAFPRGRVWSQRWARTGSSAALAPGQLAQPVEVLTKVGDLADGPLLLLLHVRHLWVLREALVLVPIQSILYICCCCFFFWEKQCSLSVLQPLSLLPFAYTNPDPLLRGQFKPEPVYCHFHTQKNKRCRWRRLERRWGGPITGFTGPHWLVSNPE